MTRPDPSSERIQAYVDGCLAADELRRFEAELTADPELRDEVEALRWLSQSSRDALGVEMPDDLKAGIRKALDREDRSKATAGSWRGWVAAAAIIAVVALGLWLVTRESTSTPLVASVAPLHLAVAQDVHDYVEGLLPLEYLTADVAAMEQYFESEGIDFPTRVFDLAMMELQVAGGLKHDLAGRESAAFVYHGPEHLRVLCQMYRGTLDELPPTVDVREHNGITFYSYEIDCVSMSFWREGDVICVLAAMGDLEQVVALAFAKAVRV